MNLEDLINIRAWHLIVGPLSLHPDDLRLQVNRLICFRRMVTLTPNVIMEMLDTVIQQAS